MWFHVSAHLNCVYYGTCQLKNSSKKQRHARTRCVHQSLCQPHNIVTNVKSATINPDMSLSYLDIVCCGIPANCLRSQPGHNYALHWTRSSRCRLSPRPCYWGRRQSCPRGLGQLQPSMARRKKKSPCIKSPFFQQFFMYCF